jgi:hypothetical protein
MPQMRRVLPFVLLVVLIPASASAQGFLRWLGRLSGPGPFLGFGGDVSLKCFGIDPPEAGVEPPQDMRTLALVGLRAGCKDARLDDPHTTIYLNVGFAIAENNPLFYGDEGEQAESTAVRMVKLGVSADFTAHKALDVGAGFGLLYFAGPRFDNFSRGYVQPVRIAFRPFMLAENADDNDGWLLLVANWQIIVGTIDGADFGAPLDNFRARNEQDVEFGATIDVMRFIRRFKNAVGDAPPKR